MITDLPTAEDFKQSGIEFLNLAWDNAIDLLINLDEWDQALESDEEETKEDRNKTYWKSAQRILTTAAALTQQGLELLLKSRIAETSVFLLISGDPRDWPKGCDKTDVPFTDFRTIDAQDLIRAHDAVYSQRLSLEFKGTFDRLRKLRNSIFHTVDKRTKVQVEEVLHTILFASNSLIGNHVWISLRKGHLSNAPQSFSIEFDLSEMMVVRELKKLVEVLPPSVIQEFIGMHPKQRRYLCCACEWACREFDIRADCAQLVPNSATSTTLHCFACGVDTTVVRKKCQNRKCPGNVLEAKDGFCCTCFEEQEI
jgi:hypothetical protein